MSHNRIRLEKQAPCSRRESAPAAMAPTDGEEPAGPQDAASFGLERSRSIFGENEFVDFYALPGDYDISPQAPPSSPKRRELHELADAPFADLSKSDLLSVFFREKLYELPRLLTNFTFLKICGGVMAGYLFLLFEDLVPLMGVYSAFVGFCVLIFLLWFGGRVWKRTDNIYNVLKYGVRTTGTIVKCGPYVSAKRDVLSDTVINTHIQVVWHYTDLHGVEYERDAFYPDTGRYELPSGTPGYVYYDPEEPENSLWLDGDWRKFLFFEHDM